MYASHGLTVQMTAEAMGVAPTTVKTHLQTARWKLCAKTTTHAVALAVRQGLIP